MEIQYAGPILFVVLGFVALQFGVLMRASLRESKRLLVEANEDRI
jgi:hypothetical protein